MLTTTKSLTILTFVLVAAPATLIQCKQKANDKGSSKLAKIRYLSLKEFKEEAPHIKNGIVLFKPDDEEYKALFAAMKLASIKAAVEAATQAALDKIINIETAGQATWQGATAKEVLDSSAKPLARAVLKAQRTKEAAISTLVKKVTEKRGEKNHQKSQKKPAKLEKEVLSAVEAWVAADRMKEAVFNSVLFLNKTETAKKEKKKKHKKKDVQEYSWHEEPDYDEFFANEGVCNKIDQVIRAFERGETELTGKLRDKFKFKVNLKLTQKEVEHTFRTKEISLERRYFTTNSIRGPPGYRRSHSPIRMSAFPGFRPKPVLSRALGASIINKIKGLFKGGQPGGIEHFFKSKNKLTTYSAKNMYKQIEESDLKTLADYKEKNPKRAEKIEKIAKDVHFEAKREFKYYERNPENDVTGIVFPSAPAQIYSKKILNYVYFSTKFKELNFSVKNSLESIAEEIWSHQQSGCEIEIFVVRLNLDENLPESIPHQECPESDLYCWFSLKRFGSKVFSSLDLNLYKSVSKRIRPNLGFVSDFVKEVCPPNRGNFFTLLGDWVDLMSW